MITTQFVLGLILVTTAVNGVIVSIVEAFAYKQINWLYGILFFGLAFGLPGAVMITETPREPDILKGNAHYIEVTHTYQNDTIKTYHIDWNKDRH